MPVHSFVQPKGTLIELEVASTRLTNLLGDPTTRTVAVYLPPCYASSTDDYPLFVDLAAFTGSGLKRLAWTAFGENVPQRIDRLVDSGAMGPVIVAFPDAFTSLGGNQYVDTPVLGQWQTFMLEDLVPALERRFRIRRGPRHRAIYGKSSGGYGALRQGIFMGQHWGAVACHSGDMAFDLTVRRDFPQLLDRLGPLRSTPAAFVDQLRHRPKLRGADVHALMVLALAASYDPAPSAPLGLRLPVDVETCELDPVRWACWLANDPIHMLEQPEAQDHLGTLGELFVDCGTRDQYFLHYGARQLHRKLDKLGVPHVYEEFDDDHSSIDYRLDQSLPRLFAAIAG